MTVIPIDPGPLKLDGEIIVTDAMRNFVADLSPGIAAHPQSNPKGHAAWLVRASNEHEEWKDIKTAPRDGTPVWVYVAAYLDLPAFQCVCAYHKDAGWCADELREATHWVALREPPVVETSIDMG